jgi:serine O-acetyltransferase
LDADGALHDVDLLTGLTTGRYNRNPTDIGFWALVREDLETHDGDLLAQGFWALFWHRFGNWRMSVRPKPLRAPLSMVYRLMFKVTEWFCGISLPYTSIVGRRVRLEHFGCMILAPRSIGSDVVLRQNTTFGIARTQDLAGRPVIEDHVDIGAGVVIVGGVTVGRGAIVGANSVVARSVPPFAVVVGAPARIIRMRDPAELGDPVIVEAETALGYPDLVHPNRKVVVG